MAQEKDTDAAVQAEGQDSEAKDLAQDAIPDQDASTDSSTEVQPKDTPTDGEKSETPAEEQVPFHEHPRFQQITKSNRDLRNQNRELEGTLRELKASVDTMKSGFGNLGNQSQAPQNAEQQQAITQLKQMLGLDKLDGLNTQLETLKGQNENLQKSHQDAQFNQLETFFAGEAKKVGMDPNQLMDMLEDKVDSNPFLKSSKSNPEAWKMAYAALSSESAFQMGQGAATKDMLAQQEKAKSAQTEKGTQTLKSSKKLPQGIMGIMSRIDEAGEIDLG